MLLAHFRFAAANVDSALRVIPGGHRRFLHHEIERFAHTRGLTLQSGRGASSRILIVDDDKQLVRFLVEFLADSANVVTELAHDGFEAGQKVHVFKPDVMLLDLTMPGMNGIEICRRMKSETSTKAIRIIAMTGYYSQENIDGVVSAGAETCLHKPLDTEALQNAIGLVSNNSNNGE